jgi:Alpha-1,3-glucanase catalytic domain D2
VYGRAVRVVGAGTWFTRFRAPADRENTDVGMAVQGSASGSTFADFAYFGNYTSRIDGPGKVFDLRGVSGAVFDDIWTEHQVVFFWGTDTDRNVITNCRIRDMFADGVNLTNGSSGNRVANCEARATGDDSFALFAATDLAAGDQTGNVYENLTSRLTWRAAGLAVYGGFGNTFRNVTIADTLAYSGVTVSSLDFGIPMAGFGADPPTSFEGVSIVRAGGHFYGNQTFPAIWMFSASKPFQGIRVTDVDIVDPTYSGVMFQSAGNPVTDTVFTRLSVTGAHRSGDQFDAASGVGILVLSSATGAATFTDLRLADNVVNRQNNSGAFTLTGA